MILLLVLLLASMRPAAAPKDEKLKPEQLIQKHLDAIGPADKLKAIKSRLTTGTTRVDVTVGGHANVDGDGNIVSQDTSLRLLFRFPSNDYPGEMFAFDGKDAMVGQISPGVRSPLGNFIFQNEEIMKYGLMFGPLSTSWALANAEGRQPRLDISGPKKVEGKSVYELKYVPKKDSNVIAYYDFDTATFRLVRSQLKVERAPVSSSDKAQITDSAEPILYTLTEHFDDYKEIDGLMLPYLYKFDYSLDSPRGGFVGAWTYTIKQIGHNQQLDSKFFSPK